MSDIPFINFLAWNFVTQRNIFYFACLLFNEPCNNHCLFFIFKHWNFANYFSWKVLIINIFFPNFQSQPTLLYFYVNIVIFVNSIRHFALEIYFICLRKQNYKIYGEPVSASKCHPYTWAWQKRLYKSTTLYSRQTYTLTFLLQSHP